MPSFGYTIPGVNFFMLPFPIKPMLLQAASEPFDSSDHIFEWKVDGVRCILFYTNGEVRLQSKTGKDCTRNFPELWELAVAADEVILDGEVTVLLNGRPDFEAVMARYLSGARKISQLVKTTPAFYVVWDILWHNGRSVMDLPLMARKKLLDNVLNDSDTVKKIDWVDKEGLEL